MCERFRAWWRNLWDPWWAGLPNPLQDHESEAIWHELRVRFDPDGDRPDLFV